MCCKCAFGFGSQLAGKLRKAETADDRQKLTDAIISIAEAIVDMARSETDEEIPPATKQFIDLFESLKPLTEGGYDEDVNSLGKP